MIAALNFALLGADHARRSRRPTRSTTSPTRSRWSNAARRRRATPRRRWPRWSSAENLALEDTSFFTDHQVGDSAPAVAVLAEQRYYAEQVAKLHPRARDGGGNETAATHGPIYYAALAPAYVAASSSPFSQLTLMRLTSALIGALTVLFTFLLARELAPGAPVAGGSRGAARRVSSRCTGSSPGAVNNDVGVNAGAAALELLLIRMLRRGVTLPWGAAHRRAADPAADREGDGYSLYPVAAIAVLLAAVPPSPALGYRRVGRSRRSARLRSTSSRAHLSSASEAAARRDAARQRARPRARPASAVATPLRLPGLPVAGLPAATPVHGPALRASSNFPGRS